jgi:hypothetical protein
MLFGALLGLTVLSTGWFYIAGWLAKPVRVPEPARATL